MGQGGAAAGQGAGGFSAFVPLILMFVIFYFLLIRPQQKKQKQHRTMIENLKKGDRIITGGGIHGRIMNVDENVLTVEIADQVKVKLNRGNVATTLQTAPPAAEKPGKAETGK
jgi:preprotein translocase subunit YajC